MTASSLDVQGHSEQLVSLNCSDTLLCKRDCFYPRRLFQRCVIFLEAVVCVAVEQYYIILTGVSIILFALRNEGSSTHLGSLQSPPGLCDGSAR